MFPARLADEALDQLASISPREMRRVIVGAFGSARLAHRDEVRPDDIERDCGLEKARIGF